MRIFKDCHEMENEVNRDIHEMGTMVHPATMQDKDVKEDKDYRTLELSPYVFQILDGSDRDIWIQDGGKNLVWCRSDFLERTSSITTMPKAINPGAAYQLRDEWEEFVHGGKFAYTYSERLGADIRPMYTDKPLPILQAVVNQLNKDPDTRHGVIPIFNAFLDGPYLDGSRRIPCSMHYQFLIRDDQVQCIYTMRSTDFFTHFAYDIWHALELQSLIAGMTGRGIGRFTFFTGSLHIYAKDSNAEVF